MGPELGSCNCKRVDGMISCLMIGSCVGLITSSFIMLNIVYLVTMGASKWGDHFRKKNHQIEKKISTCVSLGTAVFSYPWWQGWQWCW